MTGRVVVVGSVNVDTVLRVERLPRPGETTPVLARATNGGGKGANAALAAARVAPTALVACVGPDYEPDLDGVELRLAVVDVPTGRATVLVDAAGENIVLVDPGANARLDARHVHDALTGEVTVVLTNLEVGDEAVLAAAAHGATVIVNPAPVRDLPPALYDRAPILTPNADEARRLSGCDDLASAAATLRDRSGAPVVITCGADGVLLHDGETRHVAAPRVDAVDTTGAGDVFNGTLAAHLALGRDLRDAVERAVAAASESTRHRGARQSAASMPGRNSSGVTTDS